MYKLSPENLKPLAQIDQADKYALGKYGEVLMKVITFIGLQPSVSWRPYEGGGFCQEISSEYARDLEDNDLDPRVTAAVTRRKYGGRENPEARISI